MDIKDQLKDIPIDQVAEGLGLMSGEKALRRHGGSLQGDCPTGHGSEHHRCFSINLTGNYFNCFGCDAGGDNISLVELAKGLGFVEAMRYLAEHYRPDLLPELDRAGPEARPEQREYYQRAGLFDLIYQHGKELLYQKAGQEALRYLTEDRGYELDRLKETDWIYWPGEGKIKAHLKKLQPEAGEQIKALQLGADKGYSLAIPLRDRRGAITGFAKRATATGVEPKYLNTPGTDEGKMKHDLFGLHRCKGLKELVVLEGYPDALYLPTLGLKGVVAVGQGLLSRSHLEGLKAFGVKRLIISFDNDHAGPENTAKALEMLKGIGFRVYVIDPPLLAPHKDPDELVQAEGLDAYQKLRDGAESGSKWLVRHMASKHDIKTDLGLDRCLEEALEVCFRIEDRVDREAFEEALREATGLSQEVIATRLEVIEEELSRKKQEKELNDLARRIQAKTLAGDLTGVEEELRRGLQTVQEGRGLELPGPYLLEEVVEEIQKTPEGLRTGYKDLDSLTTIYPGAITIIGGRPGHGKTIFQLNLLLNMARAYPDKQFIFFSYEEARKWIALKVIMNLAGVELNRESNLGAYVNYFKDKRGHHSHQDNQKIEELGVKKYEELAGEGRLIISDRMMPGEELAPTIGHLARTGKVGAVFVDYIQKIPLQTAVRGQRYEHIKEVSRLLLEQAVTHDIPIIMGAQLARDKGATGSRVVKLENLRESGDIEQDANLVLGLYNESVVSMEEHDRELPREADLEVHILKSRAGIVGRKVTLTFEGPVLRINDSKRERM